MARWHAFWGLHNGMNDLSKAGIHTPQDLLALPHDHLDNDTATRPTDDEIEQLQEDMRRWNETHTNN